MSTSNTINNILSELERAKSLHPCFPSDNFHRLAIMQEEAGEVTMAVLHYTYEKGSISDIYKELSHTAAMCIRFMDALESEVQLGLSRVRS